MQLQINEESLPVYEALASKTRIRIIQLLSKKKMNVKDLAKELGVSSAITTMHVKKLEEANIIKTEKIGQQKISIGHDTNYAIEPTCGLATIHDFIGKVDEPRYFVDPRRMDARILWFTSGFVEYQSPNFLNAEDTLEMLEVSVEISSEFPFSNDNWPSDITFSLNGVELGTWTIPGDFADIRGKYTPDWYPDNLNQYGLLKTIRITKHLTNMNGEPLSDITINDIPKDQDTWHLRIEVKEDAEHVGGCTLFGKGFGNYDQDIKLKVYYS